MFGHQTNGDFEHRQNRRDALPSTQDVFDEFSWCLSLSSGDANGGMGELNWQKLADTNLHLLSDETLKERSAGRVFGFRIDQGLDDEAGVKRDALR